MTQQDNGGLLPWELRAIRNLIANPVSPGAASIVHQATVLLTDAQIKALPTTPFEIVAAPGANWAFVPIAAALVIDTTAGAYATIDANASITVIGNITNLSSIVESDGQVTAFLTGGERMAFLGQMYGGGVYGQAPVDSWSTYSDRALQLYAASGGTNFTDGNAANTLRVSVEFRVFDVTTGRFLTTDESGWNDETGLFD